MLFCAVTDDVLRNVALNKRSYQVSTYTDQFGAHSASLANDRDVNTCARSQSETNPWWAVDLGDETLVAQVNLINTGDNAGNDLHLTLYYVYSSHASAGATFLSERGVGLVYEISVRSMNIDDRPTTDLTANSHILEEFKI